MSARNGSGSVRARRKLTGAIGYRAGTKKLGLRRSLTAPPPRVQHQEWRRPSLQTSSAPGELTLASAASYLPSWAVKALRSAAPPLADSSLPEPEVLRAFWERADHAIRSLHESFAGY